MPDESPEVRAAVARVAEVIAENVAELSGEPDQEDIPPDSVLVKYSCVVDFMRPDGERMIVKFGGNLDGAVGATWDLDGLLYEAVFGDWG